MHGNKSQQMFGNTRFVDEAWDTVVHQPNDNVRLPFFIVLNPTRQGNGISNRTGDRINMLSVRLKGRVMWQWLLPPPQDPPVEAPEREGNQFRYLIVYDAQPLRDNPDNEAAETHYYPEILNSLFSDGTDTPLDDANIALQSNMNNLSRYTILADETISFSKPMASAEYSSGIEQLVQIDRYVKLPPECREATYDTNPAIPGWNPDLPIRGRLLIVFKAYYYYIADPIYGHNGVKFSALSRVAFQ